MSGEENSRGMLPMSSVIKKEASDLSGSFSSSPGRDPSICSPASMSPTMSSTSTALHAEVCLSLSFILICVCIDLYVGEVWLAVHTIFHAYGIKYRLAI